MPIGAPPMYEGVPGNLAEDRWPTRHDLDRVAPTIPSTSAPSGGTGATPAPRLHRQHEGARARGHRARHAAPRAVHRDRARRPGRPDRHLLEQTYKPLVEHTLMAVAPRFTLVTGWPASPSRCASTIAAAPPASSRATASRARSSRRTRPARARPAGVRAHLLWSPAWPSADAAAVLDLVRSWGAWLSRRGLGDEYLRVAGSTRSQTIRRKPAARGHLAPDRLGRFSYRAALPEDVMVEMMIEAARNYIRVGSFTPNILDLYERVNRAVPIADRRWVIEHIGVYGPTTSAASAISASSSPRIRAATSGRTAPCSRGSSGPRAPPASPPCARSSRPASTSRCRRTMSRPRSSTRSTTPLTRKPRGATRSRRARPMPCRARSARVRLARGRPPHLRGERQGHSRGRQARRHRRPRRGCAHRARGHAARYPRRSW